MEELHKAVGPWVDEQLPVTAQLMLRRVKLEAEQLDAAALRTVLMATWRGWLVERQVVQGAISELGIQLEVELPSGFSPLEVLEAERGQG